MAAWRDRKHESDDLYRTLGVDRDATMERIKAAYRRQVLLHHPDRAAHHRRFGREQAKSAEKIQHLNAAYDILSNPTTRAKYDLERFGLAARRDAAPCDQRPPSNDRDAADRYKPMTATDVHDMFSGLNSFGRLSTAQYHAFHRGRRSRGGLEERKRMRAARLPSTHATMAWVAVPLVLVAVWGWNWSHLFRPSGYVPTGDDKQG